MVSIFSLIEETKTTIFLASVSNLIQDILLIKLYTSKYMRFALRTYYPDFH